MLAATVWIVSTLLSPVSGFATTSLPSPPRVCRFATEKADSAAVTTRPEDSFSVQVNEFFKKPVPPAVMEYIGLRKVDEIDDKDIVSRLTAPPSTPGVPRPLWLVILGSVPTGILWYGYYKFSVEEELMELELKAGKTPKGFGGYGTLGPFVYGCLLGPLAFILHLPGGLNWTNLGIIFIYYTQFVLYDRVNALYREEGLEEPLSLWWTLPIFFPFDLIVGLRQVHYLSQYWYRQRGINPPSDPVVDFFPFIGAPRFTWQEFLLTPALWCSLLSDVHPVQRSTLPEPLQKVLALGEGGKDGSNELPDN